MKFPEFIGNERVVRFFQTAMEHNHLGHAFLFSGPSGVGKATLARIICKALLCRQRTANGPCDTCASCHKFESGNHPDFHLFRPEGVYFKIDQVRDIIHRASLKPVESRWKTFILQDVEHMRDEASNALLKVLEEPPGETIFFLISETAEALLPTIRSRCIHFPFQALQLEEIEKWLVQKMQYTPEEASAMARYSHGSLSRALILNADQFKMIRDRALAALEAALVPRTYFSLVDAIRSLTVERSEMGERLLILEELMRDLILLKIVPDASLVHEDARERLSPLTAKIKYRSLQVCYEKLLEIREAILKVNANINLSMQAFFLSLRMQTE